MSLRSRLIVLVVSIPILIFSVVGGFISKAVAKEDSYQHLRVFEDVVSLVTNNYVEGVDIDKVMVGALRGLADGLDPDSSYLQPQEVRLVEQNAPLPDGTAGIELTRQYYLRIIAVRDGSPAGRAGLTTGDYIRAIDGRSTRDMSVFSGARALHGVPGTKVSLTVIRGNAAEPHVIDLTLDKDAAPDLRVRSAAPGVGYVRIAAFGPDLPTRLQSELAALSRQGAASIVLDLRSTAEGPIDRGLSAARLFVASGTLAVREGRGQAKETFSAGSGDGSVTSPLVILINSGTSGAAEVFAAALAGNKRAQLIGERTLGRSAVQRLVKLPDGSGLWLSVARYLTPSGAALHGRGLVPDVEVEEPELEFGIKPPTADPVLDKALAVLSVKKAA
ncbi:MAG: PDZ domain-containing protein [Acidobacteria bacterium]|nr:PDZ domain-containing protein [Acidobacteriota bacterium]